MIAVPPFRGELGITIRFHACAVRALPRPVLVVHEPGLEALYPDCDRKLVKPLPDVQRRWTYGHDREFVDVWRERLQGHRVVMPDKENRLEILPFLPEPAVLQRPDEDPGIVVCPRRRRYGPGKNWDDWPDLVKRLRSEGHRVFAAGLEETSYRTVAHERSWDYRRPLDATIEAMRRARVVVATASGPSLLAVLCGAPLLLVGSQGGRVAPGPSEDLDGNVHHIEYWPIPVRDYYEPLDHLGSGIELVPDGWEEPDTVLRFARGMAA